MRHPDWLAGCGFEGCRYRDPMFPVPIGSTGKCRCDTVFGGLCAGCAIVPTGVDQARIINDALNSPAALVAIFAAMLAFPSGVLSPRVGKRNKM
jgi:hypothetical protein